MKLTSLFLAFFIVLFTTAVFGQSRTSTSQVKEALQLWNQTAKKSDLTGFMNLFEDSENIMLVGSDSGEIFKGKTQIGNWLSGLFKSNSFEWDMRRIDIDTYKNTAWVFVDGYMIVTNRSGNIFKRPYRFSGILVKHKEVWKWRLFHGAIPSVS